MHERESIEQQIRNQIRCDSSAVIFSNKLFAPEGLFSRLAGTEDERRALVKTQIWKDVQQRLRELERNETVTLTESSTRLLPASVR